MDIKDQKHRLKTAIKERMSRVSDGERRAESRSLCKQLVQALPAEPVTFCGYIPLTDEVDLRPAMLTLLEQGCTLFLPCFEDGKLVFRQATSLENLHEGPFHIPEPPKDAPRLHLQDLQYAIIPGRGFNHRGDRIGRGNGGYDKWLSVLRKENPNAQVWGVALQTQIHNDIPVESHDEPVDALVTARGFIDCRAERAKR